MQRDIVIVPTFDRPEYLSLCLEKLGRAAGIGQKEVWVCRDDHEDAPADPRMGQDYLRVYETANFMYGHQLRWTSMRPHNTYGNSLNVFTAFRDACSTSAKYIYLVEDDVLVMPDFFEWHIQAQEQFHPFLSCAGRINRSLNFERNGREAIDETCKDPSACAASATAYGSWAACFTRDSLAQIVFAFDPVDLMRWGTIVPGAEQDIRIQGLMRSKAAAAGSIWPYVPRAYHMGMQSYHRNAGMKFNGTLLEKINSLRATISDPARIKQMALLQDDIDPYPTEPVPPLGQPLWLKADHRKKV